MCCNISVSHSPPAICPLSLLSGCVSGEEGYENTPGPHLKLTSPTTISTMRTRIEIVSTRLSMHANLKKGPLHTLPPLPVTAQSRSTGWGTATLSS